MLALGSLAFASPWLLAALAALPVIWWLLRVTPPAPRLIAFPAIRLLLGLRPREETPARTPWWLTLLRLTLAALVIIAAAGPMWNPTLAATDRSLPLVLLIVPTESSDSVERSRLEPDEVVAADQVRA